VGFSSDLDELTRAASGDKRAASALVARYSPGVFAIATRMLGDRQAAEDVTQETFIRAWKILPEWDPRAKFSTWLHRVTLNLCYDLLRKRRDTLMAEPPEQVDGALRPDEALDQKQRLSALQTAINELPDRQAAALTLCAIEGHTNIDAAETMEISIEALESLLARARRTLRKTYLKKDAA
jgi:RNA polymerase sigma-70 factor (ECF subfamily)